ncbi:40s ribosomal protein [Musa troglodytarum]|uniref:40s ribosomal protein n=1 Tax=Musa troglodytarum TaxID=320322 RepID=A0A9E7K9Z9_9LILI|nr:40s ribosomal protein [Musa troglodytarum]
MVAPALGPVEIKVLSGATETLALLLRARPAKDYGFVRSSVREASTERWGTRTCGTRIPRITALGLGVDLVEIFWALSPCNLNSQVCGNPHGLIRKYGLMCCRQCFHSNAKEIGFIKVNVYDLHPPGTVCASDSSSHYWHTCPSLGCDGLCRNLFFTNSASSICPIND